MKKSVTFFIPLMSIIFLLSIAVALLGFRPMNPSKFPSENWEKLGEAKINQSEENDEFSFPSNGPILTAIKIKSKKGGINLHRCIIHFANGEKKSIELRNDIHSGGESRVINLPGNQSAITRFLFWYGIPQSGDQKAELEIWGKS
ncbi:MAG: hypothetical protein ACRC2O_12910 [Chitinophagaceae bacterium]